MDLKKKLTQPFDLGFYTGMFSGLIIGSLIILEPIGLLPAFFGLLGLNIVMRLFTQPPAADQDQTPTT